jgi:hypothetical protein
MGPELHTSVTCRYVRKDVRRRLWRWELAWRLSSLASAGRAAPPNPPSRGVQMGGHPLARQRSSVPSSPTRAAPSCGSSGSFTHTAETADKTSSGLGGTITTDALGTRLACETIRGPVIPPPCRPLTSRECSIRELPCLIRFDITAAPPQCCSSLVLLRVQTLQLNFGIEPSRPNG